jgi:hypothetical protein
LRNWKNLPVGRTTLVKQSAGLGPEYKGMPLSQVNAIIDEEMKKYDGVDSKFQEAILGKVSSVKVRI